MAWDVISLPKSAHDLLRKAGISPYSPIQGAAAVLGWWATFLVEERTAMVSEFVMQLAIDELSKSSGTEPDYGMCT